MLHIECVWLKLLQQQQQLYSLLYNDICINKHWKELKKVQLLSLEAN